MANINLLPWREAQREERNKQTLAMCGVMLAIAAAIVFAAKLFMDGRISHHEARNQYMQSEINALSEVIKEIEDIKEQRDKLVARMEVIQTLQENRSQIVHVFEDLVTKMPEGVFYDSIAKKDGNLKIKGKAQSNNRVSALMRNMDASDWFANTKLKVVDVTDSNSVQVSSFDVEVKEQKKNRESEEDGTIN